MREWIYSALNYADSSGLSLIFKLTTRDKDAFNDRSGLKADVVLSNYLMLLLLRSSILRFVFLIK